MKKCFDSEPVYNDKFIKTKVKISNNRVYVNFQYNKILKDNEYCTCLSVILLDSTFVNSDKECHSQIFLEECKYAIKKKKIMNTINEELELNESDDGYDDSYERINEYADYILIFYGLNNECYNLDIHY